MPLRKQIAHYLTGKESIYFGRATLRGLLTKEQQEALRILADRSRRAVVSKRLRAKVALLKGSSPRPGLTSQGRRGAEQVVTTEGRKKFHTPGCPWAASFISSDGCVTFKTRQAALDSGYVQCRTCMS